MMGNRYILKKNKSQCCGCSACANICPHNAISMLPDEAGFEYPRVDEGKCVKCHLCENICNYANSKINNSPMEAYAGVSKNVSVLQNSSSGGIFTELASILLDEQGLVYGAQLSYENENIVLAHRRIDNKKELHRIRGSKYLQSHIGNTFTEIKKSLLEGKRVLFCGTACQVDGLYGYLKKDYENLYTVDIVCHGVPSPSIYNDYLKFLKVKYKADDIQLRFRDKKKNGWQHGAVITIKKSGKIKEKKISFMMSSFYMAFMHSQIIRESCYSCKYACKNRPADITLGDFWGIQKEHPEILKRNGGLLNEENGISCILVNTEKGHELFEVSKKNIILYNSSFEKVVRKNPALQLPPSRPSDRDVYINEYIRHGYNGIEDLYKKKYGKKYPIFVIKNLIPNKIKRILHGIRASK